MKLHKIVKIIAGIICLGLLSFSQSSTASVISVAGGMNFVDPQPLDLAGIPINVLNVYNERTNVTLTGDLAFDLAPIGGSTYSGYADVSGVITVGGLPYWPPGQETFAAGTILNSYLVQARNYNATLNGSVTFDAPIVGIMITGDSIFSSNFLSFSSQTVSGLEPFNCAPAQFSCINVPQVSDSITFSADLRTLTVLMKDEDPGTIGFDPGNGIRVVTLATVPVPAAIWLFGSGLLGLLGIATRRRSKQGNS